MVSPQTSFNRKRRMLWLAAAIRLISRCIPLRSMDMAHAASSSGVSSMTASIIGVRTSGGGPQSQASGGLHESGLLGLKAMDHEGTRRNERCGLGWPGKRLTGESSMAGDIMAVTAGLYLVSDDAVEGLRGTNCAVGERGGVGGSSLTGSAVMVI